MTAVGRYPASVLLTPVASTGVCLELLLGLFHCGVEALHKRLPDTPLRSCVILCKPRMPSFPNCKVGSDLFPASPSRL